MRAPVPASMLAGLAETQGGAVTRRQALGLGMTDEQVSRALERGGWRHSGLRGVYLTSTGPDPYLTRCWAALLYAGPGAVLGLETAAWVWRLRDDPPAQVHVVIESARRVMEQPGVRVHIRVHLAQRRHPSRRPPVIRLEETVIDLVDQPGTTQDAVIDVLLRACQRRLTRADRLRAAAAGRAKMRHRALLVDVLSDVGDGVLSTLESRYLRDVERAHRLPRAERNRPEGRRGERSYRDVRYLAHGLVVELDGRAAHPGELRERDDLRDNALLEQDGTQTLRYGWRSVVTRPCETARQVARLLARGGWTGEPCRCGPSCRLPAS